MDCTIARGRQERQRNCEGLMEPLFNHEKLEVYQEAVAFCAWWEPHWRRCGSLPALRDQMDRASTSITLNLAEGNGRFTARDRSQYFRIAVGSALECAACLDVLAARTRIAPEEAHAGKVRLQRIVRMLYGLINSSTSRIGEPTAEYDATSPNLAD